MMSNLPALVRLEINGPFWSADADLLQFSTPTHSWNMRQLFVDLSTGDDTAFNILLPGTLIILCWVRTVRVLPTNSDTPVYTFTRAHGEVPPSDTLTLPAIDQRVRDGTLSLLLVQADPEQWKKQGPARQGPVTCLAGHIALDMLRGEARSRPALFRALDLIESEPGDRPGATALPGALSAHATGLTLFGQARLPWETARITAPYQLSRLVPDPLPTLGGGPRRAFRLTVETERLTETERSAIIAAWGRLATSIDPGNPEIGIEEPFVPRWVTLEVANPRSIPRMHWFVSSWQSEPASLPLLVEREELNLVLSDQALFERDRPATSLARTILESVRITRTEASPGQPARVTLTVKATRPGVVISSAGQLAYEASITSGVWGERFTLSDVEAAYHPVETPRQVRDEQQLEVPSWPPGEGATPVEPPVLWTFMPVEDGWAQLPVPNLTEQMYLDARLAREPSEVKALFSGVVAYGNDKPGTRETFPREQPWTLLLLDADELSGTWTLSQQGEGQPLKLTEISLRLSGPELVVNGLLWLATGRPTSQDALPMLDDWVSGLRLLSLRTIDPSVDLLPPLVKTSISRLVFELRASPQRFPSALLGPWAVSFDVDAQLLDTMVSVRLLPEDAFSRYLPLVWRRHRTLPMVQALPLTQSRTPPSHPSASRQLAPFELPPSGWRFGRTEGNGAAAWPLVQGSVPPAREWASVADLPVAALSLPGLVLEPLAEGQTGLEADPGTGLPQQYRHDLPYADELHALAQLPTIPREEAEVSPQPSSPRPEPARPLTRETLGEHFRKLSERASLAAADAVAASAPREGGAELRAIIEPLAWPVSVTVEADAYPGALTLANDAAGAPAASTTLSAESALKGLTGSFVEAPDRLMHLAPTPADGAREVVAGSMAAHVEGSGAFRDQRGLLREATVVQPRVLRTPVRLSEEEESFELTSLLEAVPLRMGAAPTGGSEVLWQLWFRDLPVSGGSFSRSRTRSPRAEDVNDPEAGSRGLNHLNGWEWRLAPEDSGRYVLYGLDFYPLTLEQVTLEGEEVHHVELVGRLQLPLEGGGELESLTNAVRLEFSWDAASGRLVLSSVSAESSLCEWPLGFSGGEAGEAPRIEWSQIALSDSRDRLEVEGATLVFQHLGADWRIPLERLGFSAVPEVLEHRYVATGASEPEPLPPREVMLRLDPIAFEHDLSLVLGVRLGRGVATMPEGPRPVPLGWQRSQGALNALVTSSTVRTAFSADVRFQLLSGGVRWEAGFLFEDMRLAIPEVDTGRPEESPLLVGETALQFRWRTYRLGENSRLQLLPGMHVAEGEAPGFTALAFRVLTAPNDVPTLHLESSFVEVLLRCQWGEFLQDARPSGPPSLARVFGSSAGEVVFGYTGESRGSTWDERYLLNGFLEVKDLISWPVGMSLDETHAWLTVPAARGASSLDHRRHTLRILFDQHSIPPGTLETSPGDLLFHFAPGKGWQFLAVVEHQLVDVLPGADFTSPRLQNDRRWVAVQEVRFLTPASLKASLLAQEDEHLRLRAPSGGVPLIGDAAYGYLGSGLRELLTKGTPPALDALPEGTMLVEASAIHWLKTLPVATSAPTALQYLPNGTQLATLSGPEDYAPTDWKESAWLLLQMPFLGRMQDERHDALEPPATAPPLLQVDPVLDLQRRRSDSAALPPLVLAFTSWAEATATTVKFSNFDAAVGRSWARLEPRALEESWFYLQKPPFEPPPEGLPSVLASMPDTPARLGRPVTLGVLYQGGRKFHPPKTDPNGETPWRDLTSAQLIWRPGHLQVLQAASSMAPSDTPPYGWLVTGLQLAGGLLARTDTPASTTRYHAAATVVPLILVDSPVPAALTVSPFLSLEFRPAPPPSETSLRLVVAELLCLDAITGRLRPVASQNWELGDRNAVRSFAANWARETHRRLSPESPVAVLRFREILQSGGPAVEDRAVLVTSYDFGLVPGIQPPRTLARRVFRLRSSVPELRFRDGRFGGRELPRNPRAFELAPPQMNGVQPLFLTERPAAQSMETVWPWGLSALRTSVQYTQDEAGVVGQLEASEDEGLSIWWQALQHGVQYRSGLSGRPGAGLPPAFRAEVIRSLLPILPDPPLPSVKILAPRLAHCQPVLPGAVRTTLVGARPGVFLSLRPQLVRQDGSASSEMRPGRGSALVSGSVPVQHRAPRPVPLPPNRADAREAALRPWASWFEPEVGLLARTVPVDEAFFAAFGPEPAHRLRVKIVCPARGEIPGDWDGSFSADLEPDGPLEALDPWDLEFQLSRGGRIVSYSVREPVANVPGRFRFRLAEGSVEAEVLRAMLQDMGPGDVLGVNARVTRVEGAQGFYQTLSFSFRLVDPRAQRPPLEPFFVLFEDPEYNRLLSSPAKHATGLVKTRDANGQQTVHAVTLAADRTEYDPDGQIALRFDWDDDRTGESASLFINLIDANGVSRPLGLRREGAIQRPVILSSRTLLPFSLPELHQGDEPVRLAGGETLEFSLLIPGDGTRIVETVTISLTVDVAIEPVTPVPQAGYALLRRQESEGQTQVECVRFAWSPPATRVELVSPEDLRTQLVRRRAVFLWTDTARNLAATGYAVQKLALTGSTHFPIPDVLERIVCEE